MIDETRRYTYKPYRLPGGGWIVAEYLGDRLVAHLEHQFHTCGECLHFLRSKHWSGQYAHPEGYSYEPILVGGWWTIGEYMGSKLENHIGEFYTSKEEAEHFLSSRHWPRLQNEGEQ